MDNKLSRSDFLSLAGVVTTGLVLSSLFPGCRSAQKRKKIDVAIIGGGIAGLTAGLKLKKSNIDFCIYEALPHLGGRMRSAENLLFKGDSVELGGEFIGEYHPTMLSLCKQFNISLQDRSDKNGEGGLKQLYYVDGIAYSEMKVVSELGGYLSRIRADQEKLGNKILAGEHNAYASALDKLSITDYFDKIGMSGWIRKLLGIVFLNAYGIPLDQQSAINFLITCDPDALTSSFEFLDERYRIIGGSNTLSGRIADEIGEAHIEYGYTLESVRETISGTFVLAFRNGKEVETKKVIFTLPFSVLRYIDIKAKNFDAKRRMIDALTYATDGKILLGFEKPTWRENGYSGETWNSLSEASWENTSGIINPPYAGMTVYSSKVMSAEKAANDITEMFPGARYTGKSYTADWKNNPFSMGTYASYAVGMYTSIAGEEHKPVGNLHFAGEHTSLNFAGYMEGAAESGLRVVEEVLRK